VIEIGIAHSTEKRPWLEWARQEFAVSEMSRGIRVNLLSMESLDGAHAILDGDERIHVWAPASRLYLETFRRDWAARHGADPRLRRDPIVKAEDLALTPMMIVMWKGRYDALLTRAPDVSLKTIGYAMHAETGWGAIAGKPEWGHFKFGHTHPGRSDSGLMVLILLAYDFYGKTSGLTVKDVVASKFQQYLAWFASGASRVTDSTDELMKNAILRGPSVYDALMVYESAAIDYFKKAEGRWEEFKVVYPKYNLWNDNPYCILDTPWTAEAHQKAADTFLQFLMSEPVQSRAMEHGFRPGDPSVPLKGPDSPFVQYAENGLRLDLPVVCEPPSREVTENLQQSWMRNTGRP
jgi:ABC-type Fe3+ transport system substrate-binding protein